jgi:hypothetical protein
VGETRIKGEFAKRMTERKNGTDLEYKIGAKEEEELMI